LGLATSPHLLTGQVIPSQTLPGDRSENFVEAFCVRRFSLVIAKRLLIEVSEQMERLNTHIGTADGSFQETPEVLHAVRMDRAVSVLLSVVNDLVRVLRIKPVVREKFVRHDFRSAPNVFLNDPGKFMLPASLDVLDMDLPGIALKQPENDLLSDRTATVDLGFPLVLVHKPRFAADKGFVRFNLFQSSC
jgi:hypothetical protein